MSFKKINHLFRKGCADYGLLEDGDNILVAVSGGKDSLMLAELIAAQAKIFKPGIHVEAAHVVMDSIPYEADISWLERFCGENGLKLHVLHSSFDKSTDRRKTECFLCAWNRRKTLFQFAQDNGFNKVALGHHMDDFLVTYLMNLVFEGSATTMRPIMAMEHYPLSVIRPLCLVPEEMIKAVAEEKNYLKQKASCPYEQQTQRAEMTRLLRQLEEINPEARYSLWHAVGKS